MPHISIHYYWQPTETLTQLNTAELLNIYRRNEFSLGAILICEVAQSVTSSRLANDGPVNGALGVVDQRPFARDTGRSLEEETHGERLEAVESEFQLGLGGAVEETALARHTTVAGEHDVLAEEPQTMGGRDGRVIFEHHTGDLLHLWDIYERKRILHLHLASSDIRVLSSKGYSYILILAESYYMPIKHSRAIR